MSNLIQDKILALAPAATVKEGEVLTVTVPAENFHAVAQMLRDDKEMQCALAYFLLMFLFRGMPFIDLAHLRKQDVKGKYILQHLFLSHLLQDSLQAYVLVQVP